MTRSKSPENSISRIVEEIASQGYAVIENFLNQETLNALSAHAQHLKTRGLMHKATTGLNNTPSTIRGDFIHWIEEEKANAVEQAYLRQMSQLQSALNQSFFLSLIELESHFAIYPPNAGYQKHLDQFIGKEERKISCILYLNQDWLLNDGGALRIHLDKMQNQTSIDIIPNAGTIVVFLSSDFIHEVLPAKRERVSITGWFRTRKIEMAS